MDGLLLDSERLARETFVSACRGAGWEPDLAVYDLCVGSTYEGTERILKTEFGPEFPFVTVNEAWGALYEAHVLHQPVDVKAGALALLLRLVELDIPRALATSTKRPIARAKLNNADLHGYPMMTIKDAPEIFSGVVDSYEPRGPYGAKEIGEGSTLPVLGAVAHAIANATGVWIKDLPITPEKILRALRER